jgi:predicted RNase H-like HicB family nuclease
MKTVEYYLELNYKTSVYRDDEGNFVVEVDDLPGCVTDGRSPDEAFRNLEEAKHAWVESRLAAGLEVPEPRQIDEYSGKVLLRMPRSLHRRLVGQSAEEGVSLNQYVVSLLSYASAGNRAFSPTAQPVHVVYQYASSGKTELSNYLVGTKSESLFLGKAAQIFGCLQEEFYVPSTQQMVENQQGLIPTEESRKWVRPQMLKI